MSSKKASTSVPKLIRSGNVGVRERSTFGGTAWKTKKLELDNEALTIINTSSNRRTRISLQDVAELERTDLTDHSLCLRAKDKRYNLSFSSDPELYDWQDDIYQRCPLGNYSSPFDFVHKSHIGADNPTGNFGDTTILPIYAEIMGGVQQPAAKAGATSRPASNIPLGVVKVATTSTGGVILEGLYTAKLAGVFAALRSKQRWVTLTPQALIIHRQSSKTSPASKTIPLPALTQIEPHPKLDNCLLVEFTTRPSSARTELVSIVFKSNPELYTWRDALYLRSALSSPIGNPTNLVHHVHVGVDPNGTFTGLPVDWQGTVGGASGAAAVSAADKKARRQSRRKSAPLVTPPPTASAAVV
ncbi:hypothetical protein D9619_003716 [Psilocybe cf. subviscida]|uniref:Non-specific serine/threonine protein kinase n=1 Tax=Psilocybe cf. subviscida TaxID=2480587 RepID=A0A8H5EUI1_9AGAR|nr:hypothetical protein D9619_003716 [Psilocybe cf. subviscida]